MKVTVKFIGSLQSLAGKSKLTLTLKDSTALKEAIREIIEKLPNLKAALMESELRSPRSNNLILINGKEISVLNGLETNLKDGDDVVFIPVSHGG
ncbi:MAG: MoaD/ThiS family protein [Candidatus Bathyarchaeia archaeon]